jgi:hypothetical protein
MRHDVVAFGRQEQAQRIADGGVVVDDMDGRLAHSSSSIAASGSVKLKVAPPSLFGPAHIFP